MYFDVRIAQVGGIVIHKDMSWTDPDHFSTYLCGFVCGKLFVVRQTDLHIINC